MRVISFLNQKGGVGKTTLAINVAGEFALQGHKVLFVDADPQGSALDWSETRQEKSLFDTIALPRPVLHKEIPSIGKNYDKIIIDSPPSVHAVSKSIIGASNVVIIPIQPSPYDIWAAQDVLNLIEEASVFAENLIVAFVINRKIANTAIARDILDSLESYKTPILESSIGQRVVFAESAAQGKIVSEIEANSEASKEIKNLTNEIIKL